MILLDTHVLVWLTVEPARSSLCHCDGKSSLDVAPVREYARRDGGTIAVRPADPAASLPLVSALTVLLAVSAEEVVGGSEGGRRTRRGHRSQSRCP